MGGMAAVLQHPWRFPQQGCAGSSLGFGGTGPILTVLSAGLANRSRPELTAERRAHLKTRERPDDYEGPKTRRHKRDYP